MLIRVEEEIKRQQVHFERTVELRAKVPDLYIFSGDDAIDYPILATGGKGITSVTANLLPDLQHVSLLQSALRGDFEVSRELNSIIISD